MKATQEKTREYIDFIKSFRLNEEQYIADLRTTVMTIETGQLYILKHIYRHDTEATAIIMSELVIREIA